MEWKLTPEYINDTWTEELLQLMLDSRAKRLKGTASGPAPAKKMSNQDFFRKHANRIGYHHA